MNSSFYYARWIFLRLLGLIYFAAFVSLWVQVQGLYGSRGLLPLDPFLNTIREQVNWVRYAMVPSVFWISSSDLALHVVCAVGALFSLALVFGVAPVVTAPALWFLYLSFLSVGRSFLSFQWDVLLLETGFLAIFLSPFRWKSSLFREAPPAKISVWLMQWLLFRLMFSSGLVKLISGDPTWRNLTALTFHYETQPLPVWTSWFLHHAPVWFQKFSTVGMFAIELIAPLFIFASRPFRRGAGVAMIFLQVLILLSGNYTFFNYLAIALCLFLFDDAVFPQKFKTWFDARRKGPVANEPVWPKWVARPFLAVMILFSTMATTMRWGIPLSYGPFEKALITIGPLHLFNAYGLFSVMTTTRNEIVLEGTFDGKEWREYEFKYKPGDLAERPRFVAPHQPRLDWQMWFAALGTYEQNPWFVNLALRLLEGSRPVEALLKTNPFPDHPPQAIRGVMYRYQFTTAAEKRENKNWWKRKPVGIYLPAIGLKKS